MTKIIYLVLINLVTPKARAKHEPFVQQTGLGALRVQLIKCSGRRSLLIQRQYLQSSFKVVSSAGTNLVQHELT